MKRFILKHLPLYLIVGLIITACSDDDKNANPAVTAVTPDKGSSNTLLTLTGSEMGNVVTAVFDKGNVKTDITPTFNTENALLIRVPADAVPGEQHIVLTNKNGKQFSIPFNVLGFANITNVSNYNFSEGETLTLTGKNLDDVTKVIFTGTTDEIEIVSKSATSLALKFPATSLIQSTLDITNAAGAATTTQSFVSRDNAFPIFIDDYENGFQDGSWGAPGTITSDQVKAGDKSVVKNYQKGNWHLINFADWSGLSNDNYTYLTFWVRGASQDYTLYLTSNLRAAGFGNSDKTTPIVVPANTWTYFKIPMSDAKLWQTDPAGALQQLGFWIMGPDKQDEYFYYDDVMLLK